jgi:hypothetical protein
MPEGNTSKQSEKTQEHLKSLRDKYDKLAAKVPQTAVGTPERYAVMQEKAEAFKAWHDAQEAVMKSGDPNKFPGSDVEQAQGAPLTATPPAPVTPPAAPAVTSKSASRPR